MRQRVYRVIATAVFILLFSIGRHMFDVGGIHKSSLKKKKKIGGHVSYQLPLNNYERTFYIILYIIEHVTIIYI